MNEDAVRSVMADLEEAYREDPWYRRELTRLANGWAEIRAGEENLPVITTGNNEGEK